MQKMPKSALYKSSAQVLTSSSIYAKKFLNRPDINCARKSKQAFYSCKKYLNWADRQRKFAYKSKTAGRVPGTSEI